MTDKKCSFCSRVASVAGHMVARDDGLVRICEQCTMASARLIEGNKATVADRSDSIGVVDITPSRINGRLNDYVVGQHHAKKVLSVAVYNHYKRLFCPRQSSVHIRKSNVMMVGPTGVGKTLLAETIAKTVGVPFAIADATTVTEAGYVGEDVENILLKLIQSANMDVATAERGIIYIDEIDKCRKSSNNVSITRDVSGEGVQRGLLKLIEGTVSNVPPEGGRKHPEQKFLQLDTTNILFILGGSFVGLEEIIARRLGRRTIGFAASSAADAEDRDDILRFVTHDDLVEFGMIPELVGRCPVLTSLKQLSRADMRRILTEPKDALLRQYQEFFLMDGATLDWTEGALDAIVDKAMERKTGARALRAIAEEIMLDAMYELPDVPLEDRRPCLLTVETVLGKEPLVHRAA